MVVVVVVLERFYRGGERMGTCYMREDKEEEEGAIR